MSKSDNGGCMAGGGGWFIGFIGAIVYFWQLADTFSEYIWGFVQALFWPGILVYRLFDFIG